MIGVPYDPLDTLRLDTHPLRHDKGDFSRRTTH